MNNPTRHIPVSELPSAAEFEDGGRVTWDFELPPTIDQERITLDVKRLERIQKIAAFRSSHVVSHRGETTTYSPNIGGINMDGTGTVGLGGQLQEAPKSTENLHDDFPGYPDLMQDYGKTRTVHFINKSEIAANIGDRTRQHGTTREEEWAKGIDGALRHSLRESAQEHLINRESRRFRIATLGIYALQAAQLGNNIVDSDAVGVMINTGSLAAAWALMHGGGIASTTRLYGGPLLEHKRWSLNVYPGMQPDRYLAASALTRVAPLVKYQR